MPRTALLCALLVLSACDRSARPAHSSVRQYQVRGIVRGFAPDQSTVEIEHEAIPGFMPAMTMPFMARDRKEIRNLQRGDAIDFRLEITESDVWIAEVKKIPGAEVQLAGPDRNPSTLTSTSTSVERLREGDAMPAFQLTNETGELINLETYRGRPWVLTFIFTRCPMPTFCPRISRNFSELEAAVGDGNGRLAQARLLSITIDPQFDTPAVLKKYGEQEGANPAVWSFATGDPSEIDRLTKGFAVYQRSEGGTISHGLTTALIGRDGKIAKLWRGNSWTVEEIVRALESCP